ncbi:hypothetical protein ACIQF6_01675 [Kitasatospora sp. NPDC092948]|uniref:hypothetical protein n=1 Tax=Kitasatospora sp. NPDC092948 TaxID=3364088 RepID=UPI003820FB34
MITDLPHGHQGPAPDQGRDASPTGGSSALALVRRCGVAGDGVSNLVRIGRHAGVVDLHHRAVRKTCGTQDNTSSMPPKHRLPGQEIVTGIVSEA